ncbi:MAG: CsbD family protein [Chloroflexia bacterium]|nr:CsbD family protein [Chloroflexia bacterium]
MNSDILKGNWKQMQGSAKSKWGDLADDDHQKMEGDRDNMVGVVQKRYGKTREDAEREVDDFIKSN